MKTIQMNLSEKELTIREAFKEFYKIKRVLNLAEDTLDFYEFNFDYFGKFYDIDRPCSDLTQDDIFEYIIYLKNLGTLKDRSINTRLSALRTIVYYFKSKRIFARRYHNQLNKMCKKGANAIHHT